MWVSWNQLYKFLNLIRKCNCLISNPKLCAFDIGITTWYSWSVCNLPPVIITFTNSDCSNYVTISKSLSVLHVNTPIWIPDIRFSREATLILFSFALWRLLLTVLSFPFFSNNSACHEVQLNFSGKVTALKVLLLELSRMLISSTLLYLE